MRDLAYTKKECSKLNIMEYVLILTNATANCLFLAANIIYNFQEKKTVAKRTNYFSIYVNNHKIMFSADVVKRETCF